MTGTTQARPTSAVDRFFKISERGSSVSQEVRGGLVTFFAMAYIIVLNPLIIGGFSAEQAAVGAIWRGETATIARLSSRYSPPMQLIGKLYRSKGGWAADWTFVDNGRVLSKWSTSEGDARRAMAGGADGAADALTKRYAKRSPSGPPGKYRVTFTGIDDGADAAHQNDQPRLQPRLVRREPVVAIEVGGQPRISHRQRKQLEPGTDACDQRGARPQQRGDGQQ